MFPAATLDPQFAPTLRSAADRLFDLIDRFATARVLVVGDMTLDEFAVGWVERISREAPVPIVRHERTRQVPGGGANAVYNLAKLGAQVTVAGLIGQDLQGEALRRIFATAGVDTSGLVQETNRPTVTKTRISAHSRQSVTQQLVRLDRKSDDPPEPQVAEQLAAFVGDRTAQVQAVVCSDYGDGVFSPPVIAAALQHSLTIVDAQVDLDRFAGATWFTPNLPEAEQAVGYSIHTAAGLERAGRDLLAKTAAQGVLITRGDEGMSVFDRAGNHQQIPVFNKAEVYDVTGAGDTVVAGLTLGLILGATPWEAAVLGNLAASLVVRHIGTATTTAEELRTTLRALLDVAIT